MDSPPELARQPEGPTYVEHAPAPELARYIECYWSVDCRFSAAESLAARILPDGCMDILFDLGDPPARAGRGVASPAVIGSMTTAITVEYRGHMELMGVRFRPGGATPWLRPPASELTDQVVPLEELWGRAGVRAHERLGEVPAELRVAQLDSLLIRRLRRAARPADERVLGAAEAMIAHDGRLPVARLAKATGLGRRQLERRFLACVGLSPKTASRIARLRSATSRMRAEPTAALSGLALEAGYADQAHMNRDFRALARTTPGSYRAELRR